MKITHFRIAQLALIILLFVSFFGNDVPFREDITDVDDIASSNIVNQLVFSFLFFVSLYLLVPKFNRFLALLKTEKFLTILILWCIVTILWSSYPDILLKRIFQQITIILTFSVVFLHAPSIEELLKTVKYVLYPYIIISLAVCLVIPGAKDAKFNTWRGFASTKNNLGQAALMCTIFCYIFVQFAKTNGQKIVASIFMLLSMVLLIGSFSSTSILSLGILLGIIFLPIVTSIFEPLGVSKMMAGFIFVSLLTLASLIIFFLPEAIAAITDVFGKDTSFSGRTDLWEYIWLEVEKHFLLGAGYQSFWVFSSDDILSLYQVFLWLPNQSHNGYLDVLNEIGVVGLGLLIWLLVVYFIRVFSRDQFFTWGLFMATIVINNLQETSFLRTGHVLNLFFFFSYLIVFADIKETSEQEELPQLRFYKKERTETKLQSLNKSS